MAKNHHAKHTHHLKRMAKRITHWKDFGKAPEPIYVPRGSDMMTKPTMTQMMKENPISLITPKTPPQANPLLKSWSQKN